MTRIALVTNTPPPYRVPVFNRLAARPGIDFHAVFCARREPNRFWDLPPAHYSQHFLRERFLTLDGRYVHHNPDVVPLLSRLAPDVVITDGFNPTHLYAFACARLRRWPHIAMTDGTERAERSLSLMHRLVRRLVYRQSQAFIAACDDGIRLYRAYGIEAERCFYSWLCVDNDAFAPQATTRRPYDFLFCGRMEACKDPLFALSVARETALMMQRRLRLLFVGSGSLDDAVRDAAAAQRDWVDVHFHGFARQDELPGLYRSARVFLFPTHADVWGVVTNEACAAGLPVIVSPAAGVAGELVLENRNGFIRDLQTTAWAHCARRLLEDAALWQRFSAFSLQRVRRYEFDSAAQGILDACALALGERVGPLSARHQPGNGRP